MQHYDIIYILDNVCVELHNYMYMRASLLPSAYCVCVCVCVCVCAAGLHMPSIIVS